MRPPCRFSSGAWASEQFRPDVSRAVVGMAFGGAEAPRVLAGRLGEGHDVRRRLQTGRVPQAFSELALIVAAGDVRAAGPTAKRVL